MIIERTNKQHTTRNFAIRKDQDAWLSDLADRNRLSVSFVLRYILDDWTAIGRSLPDMIPNRPQMAEVPRETE